jgi:hypothetical protein
VRVPGAILVGIAVLATEAIGQPKEKKVSYRYDAFRQTVRPLNRATDPALGIRKLTGNHREAANVDENDAVRLPSTWWTPRVGFHPLTSEQMLEGSGATEGPAPPPWTIVQAKELGVSPGFQIVDANKVRWAIKFDPPPYPEMATGADVVTSKLLWAAGYNVPNNVIVTFRREDLVLKPDITYRDPIKGRLPVTEAYIDTILGRVARNSDGSWRAVASQFLKGKPLGEFEYDGRREDDPDDLIPHEHRRELRGMWTINAWLWNDDCSARNTLDMWVTENGRSFVRHHFIDFSGTLGAASINKHSPRGGYENLIDYGTAVRNLLTLGLIRAPWEKAVDPGLPAVGFIDVETFDPGRWKPFLPNPAFDERTRRDVEWGARIVAGFDEDLIRAAVQQGRYTDPRAEEYLVRVLIGRRDKIVAKWLDGRTASR